MKKTILFFALVFAVGIHKIQSQTIYGQVYDTTDDTPLSGATIYLNGTSIGTISDDNKQKIICWINDGAPNN